MDWEKLVSDSSYTDAAKRVLFFARHEAALSGASAVEPAHLILGLLRERRSLFPIRPMCSSAVATIRERLLENVATAGEKGTTTLVGFAPESQVILADAKVAGDAAVRAIDVKDILKSLLRCSDAGIKDALARSGVDVDSLLNAE